MHSIPECSWNGRRKVQADFDSGRITSDGGVLLLREMDMRLGIIK